MNQIFFLRKKKQGPLKILLQ